MALSIYHIDFETPAHRMVQWKHCFKLIGSPAEISNVREWLFANFGDPEIEEAWSINVFNELHLILDRDAALFKMRWMG